MTQILPPEELVTELTIEQEFKASLDGALNSCQASAERAALRLREVREAVDNGLASDADENHAERGASCAPSHVNAVRDLAEQVKACLAEGDFYGAEQAERMAWDEAAKALGDAGPPRPINFPEWEY